MNNTGEKYLPIGTVVMLKGASKRLMITGFCSMAEEDPNVMYDYAGCMYPEGFLSSEETALFNHDQIETIYHMGLVDDEEKTFKENLKGMLAASAMASNPAPTPVATPVAAPVAAPVQSNGIKFDANGVVVADSTPVAPQAPTTSANGIKFDANGVVISA